MHKKTNYFYEVRIYIKVRTVRTDLLMAGVERIELPSKVLETPMLPLYHTPGSDLIIIYIMTKFKKKRIYYNVMKYVN